MPELPIKKAKYKKPSSALKRLTNKILHVLATNPENDSNKHPTIAELRERYVTNFETAFGQATQRRRATAEELEADGDHDQGAQ